MLSWRPGRRERDGTSKQGLAERAGFEPATELSPCDGLANRCLRPLGHLSSELVGRPFRSKMADMQHLTPSGPTLRSKRVGYPIPLPLGPTLRSKVSEMQHHFPPEFVSSIKLISCCPDKSQGKSRTIGWRNERGPFQYTQERASRLRAERRLWQATDWRRQSAG